MRGRVVLCKGKWLDDVFCLIFFYVNRFDLKTWTYDEAVSGGGDKTVKMSVFFFWLTSA